MRKLKLFLDAKAANTPPQGISKASRVIFSVLTLLFLSIGQVWATEGDVVYTLNTAANSIPIASSNTYTNYADATNNWKVTCGAKQTDGLWLGSNSNQKAKMILSNGSYSEGTAIATALGIQASATYYAAIIGTSELENVGKVTLTYTTPGGTAPSEAWICYSTNSGSTWSVAKKVTTLSTSGTDFEFDETIESARYAFVIHSTNYCQFKLPVLTFYEGETSGGGDVIVKTLKSIAVSGQTTTYDQFASFSFDGTCTATYSVTKNDVAQDDEEKTVTPTSVSSPDMTTTGVKTVTVTYTENEVEKTTTYDITVNEHVVTPGEYDITPNNTFFNTDASGSITGDAASLTYTGTQDDITISYAKGSGSYMYINASQVRMYPNNTMVISVPAGYVITSVVFTGSTWPNAMNANVGSVADDKKTWSGSANSITFTGGGSSGNNQCTAISVTYEAVAPEVTVSQSSLSFEAKQNVAVEGKTFTLTGANLESGLTLAASSEAFVVSPTSLTKAEAEAGATITVTPATPTTTTTPVEGTVTISGGGLSDNVVVNLSMAVTPTYLVAVAVNSNTMGSATINGGTAAVYVTEDDEIALLATPESGHEFVNWTVSDENIVLNDEDAASTTALAGAAGTITANFQAQSCASLAAPILDEVTKTYNSATIAWNAVTNAEGYVLNIVKHSDASAVLTDEVIVAPEVSYAIASGLEANTQYDFTVMAIGDGTSYCDENNPLLDGSFTTNDYPAATLTLSDASGTSAFAGSHKLNDVIQLPATAANCSKTFVGWSANSECAVAPEYAPGADYTLSAISQTVYAVYADVTGGGTSTTNIAYSGSTTSTLADGENEADVFGLDESDWSVISHKHSANTVGINKDGTIRLYYNASGNTSLEIIAPQTITSVGVTCKENNDNIIVKVGSNTITLEDGVYPINATSFEIVNGYTSNTQVHIQNIAVNFTTAGTQSNWSTTCTAAPEAIVDPEEVNAPAAGVANGIIGAVYDNVNESAVAVALYNNAACTEAFDGEWLTASLNGDKNIAYTIAENTSYNDARTAYIKLTAPETTAATDPAVVVIPVSQAKKAAVFSSLEELVAADVNANTNVTVSFSNVTIKEIYYFNSNRRGLVFDIQKADADIKIYYNADVPAAWVAGGKVSGTLTDCPWKTYQSTWQLAPSSGWAWNNLEYTEPAEVSTVVVSGAPTKTTYVDGEKLNPAGLTVTVTYTDESVEVNPVGVTFSEVTLSEGDESADITATFGSVTSAAYNVTGLTVTAIPDKTIAQFIAAGGTRCYLEGTVSNYANKTKGYFDLTDASGTIYIYGCDAPSSFAAGDKIKVIAEDYEYYNSKHEAKNVVFVSKISPVEITIADKTLEEGASWTIEATTDPATAVDHISYEIKDDGSDAFISLAGNVITANAAGTATIIASIPNGEGYLANSIEFEVEVVEAGSVANVVILVEYEGAWYAMKHDLSGVEVDYQPAIGKIYGMTDPVAQAEIVWSRSKTGTTYTFTYGDNYLKGGSKTDLSVGSGASGTYQWEKGAEETYYHCLTGRTFIYNGTAFKNYAVTNAGNAGYSSMPKVELSDDIFTSHTIYTRNVSGNYGTICLPKAGVMTNGVLYEISYYDADQKKIFFDEVEGGVMVAGAPYIFKPNENVTELKVAYTDVAVVDNAGHKNGLYGHYDLNNPTEGAEVARLFLTNGDYFLRNNEYWLVDQEDRVYVDNYRAYIKLDKIGNDVPPQAYGRRRVAMNVNGEQVATGFENLNASEKPVKLMIDGNIYILRGEKLYDTTGRLVK